MSSIPPSGSNQPLYNAAPAGSNLSPSVQVALAKLATDIQAALLSRNYSQVTDDVSSLLQNKSLPSNVRVLLQQTQTFCSQPQTGEAQTCLANQVVLFYSPLGVGEPISQTACVQYLAVVAANFAGAQTSSNLQLVNQTIDLVNQSGSLSPLLQQLLTNLTAEVKIPFANTINFQCTVDMLSVWGGGGGGYTPVPQPPFH